jgi:hypothetical protein
MSRVAAAQDAERAGAGVHWRQRLSIAANVISETLFPSAQDARNYGTPSSSLRLS